MFFTPKPPEGGLNIMSVNTNIEDGCRFFLGCYPRRIMSEANNPSFARTHPQSFATVMACKVSPLSAS